VSYRDESDALRSRVQHLEGELASAEEKIARLRGEAAPTSPGTKIVESRLIGGPARYEREELLDYEIGEEGYEKIAEVLRTRLQLPNVSQVGRSLVAPNVFSLTREDGGTRVRMTVSWEGLKGSPISFGVLASLLGGLPVVGVLADVATHQGPWYLPLFAIGIVPAVAAAGAVLGRKLSRKRSTEGLAGAQGAFETILEIAEAHRIGPRARVELDEEEELEDDEAPIATARKAARE
jgi:hypothetical protein